LWIQFARIINAKDDTASEINKTAKTIFEDLLVFGLCEEWIKVCAKAVIAHVAYAGLGFAFVRDCEATAFQQFYQQAR